MMRCTIENVTNISYFVKNDQLKKHFAGRPANETRKIAFDAAITHLEQNLDEVLTVSDLRDFIEQCLEGCDDEPYDKTYIKRILTERYGSDVVIAERDGTPDVVTLRQTASQIIQNFYTSGSDMNNENEQ